MLVYDNTKSRIKTLSLDFYFFFSFSQEFWIRLGFPGFCALFMFFFCLDLSGIFAHVVQTQNNCPFEFSSLVAFS